MIHIKAKRGVLHITGRWRERGKWKSAGMVVDAHKTVVTALMKTSNLMDRFDVPEFILTVKQKDWTEVHFHTRSRANAALILHVINQVTLWEMDNFDSKAFMEENKQIRKMATVHAIDGGKTGDGESSE